MSMKGALLGLNPHFLENDQSDRYFLDGNSQCMFWVVVLLKNEIILNTHVKTCAQRSDKMLISVIDDPSNYSKKG